MVPGLSGLAEGAESVAGGGRSGPHGGGERSGDWAFSPTRPLATGSPGSGHPSLMVLTIALVLS